VRREKGEARSQKTEVRRQKSEVRIVKPPCLVYAYENEGQISTSACSRTKRAARARAEISQLAKLARRAMIRPAESRKGKNHPVFAALSHPSFVRRGA
jgi:hypothetical protein